MFSKKSLAFYIFFNILHLSIRLIREILGIVYVKNREHSSILKSYTILRGYKKIYPCDKFIKGGLRHTEPLNVDIREKRLLIFSSHQCARWCLDLKISI